MATTKSTKDTANFSKDTAIGGPHTIHSPLDTQTTVAAPLFDSKQSKHSTNAPLASTQDKSPEKASAQAQAKRTIFMGHPEHIAGEEAFQRGQGLWLLRADWRQLPRPHQPQPARFDAWLASLDNRSVTPLATPVLARSVATQASRRARKLAAAPASTPHGPQLSARPGSRGRRGARSRRRREPDHERVRGTL